LNGLKINALRKEIGKPDVDDEGDRKAIEQFTTLLGKSGILEKI